MGNEPPVVKPGGISIASPGAIIAVLLGIWCVPIGIYGFIGIITYVLIPTEHGERPVLYGGGVREPDDDRAIMFPGRNRSGRALRGFGLAYARDDEHVLKLGVKLDRSGASTVLRDNDAREEVAPKVASRILPVE